jgi:hypothetical protein
LRDDESMAGIRGAIPSFRAPEEREAQEDLPQPVRRSRRGGLFGWLFGDDEDGSAPPPPPPRRWEEAPAPQRPREYPYPPPREYAPPREAPYPYPPPRDQGPYPYPR